MSKTITITEFLRNPKKVQQMVKEGLKIYVLNRGEVVMVISLPQQKQGSENKKNITVPTINSGIKNYTITKQDIYSRNSWLDK